jgi:hypothetical protein
MRAALVLAYRRLGSYPRALKLALLKYSGPGNHVSDDKRPAHSRRLQAAWREAGERPRNTLGASRGGGLFAGLAACRESVAGQMRNQDAPARGQARALPRT